MMKIHPFFYLLIISALFFVGCTMSSNTEGAATFEGRSTPERFKTNLVSEIFNDPQARALAKAACKSDTKKMIALLKNHIAVDAIGVDNITPLHWALKCKNLAGMRFLLENKANPNQRLNDDYGYTPVIIAAGYDDPSFLKLLLEFGGNPNAESGEGHDTALSFAISLGARSENWDKYYLLLDAGADVNHDHFSFSVARFMVGVYGRYSKGLELLDRGYNKDLPALLHLAYTRSVPEESKEHAYREEFTARLKQLVTDEEYQAFLDSRK